MSEQLKGYRVVAHGVVSYVSAKRASHAKIGIINTLMEFAGLSRKDAFRAVISCRRWPEGDGLDRHTIKQNCLNDRGFEVECRW